MLPRPLRCCNTKEGGGGVEIMILLWSSDVNKPWCVILNCPGWVFFKSLFLLSHSVKRTSERSERSERLFQMVPLVALDSSHPLFTYNLIYLFFLCVTSGGVQQHLRFTISWSTNPCVRQNRTRRTAALLRHTHRSIIYSKVPSSTFCWFIMIYQQNLQTTPAPEHHQRSLPAVPLTSGKAWEIFPSGGSFAPKP